MPFGTKLPFFLEFRLGLSRVATYLHFFTTNCLKESGEARLTTITYNIN